MGKKTIEDIQQGATARGWRVALGEPVKACNRDAWRPIARLLATNCATVVLFYYKERLYVATTKCVATKLRINFNSLPAFSADAFVVDRTLTWRFPEGWKILEAQKHPHTCVVPAETVLHKLMQDA